MICESTIQHHDLLKPFNNLWDQKNKTKKSKGKSSKFHLKTKDLLIEAKIKLNANQTKFEETNH